MWAGLPKRLLSRRKKEGPGMHTQLPQPYRELGGDTMYVTMAEQTLYRYDVMGVSKH